MAKAVKLEARTISFIRCLMLLKERDKMPANKDLSDILGIKSVTTISEIKGGRQNIQPDSWLKFMESYKSEFPEFVIEIQKQKLIKDFDRSGKHTFEEAIDFDTNTPKSLIKKSSTLLIDEQAYDHLKQLAEILKQAQETIYSQQQTIKYLTEKPPDMTKVLKNG